MSMETITLAEFILARIAEDEAAAQALTYVGSRGGDPIASATVHAGSYPSWTPAQVHAARHSRDRVLRQCEAFRRIVELSQHGCGDDYERVQRALAATWSDHPDYPA